MFAASDSPRSKRILLQGWEQFDEPVDRIVSIGAFEHFGRTAGTTSSRWPTGRCPTTADAAAHDHRADPAADDRTRLPLTFSIARFVKFILTEIFPGGYLPTTELAGEHAAKAGFN